MKYGESAFEILYLLFAVTCGIVLIAKARGGTVRIMGAAALVLGCGDAFHLVPRVLDAFSGADYTAALGVGKLITSLTMTVFYVLLFFIWQRVFSKRAKPLFTAAVFVLAACRFALCLLPQNGWLQNSADMTWGVIRNIPFVLLGAAVCAVYFRARREDGLFARFWLYILLSFLFYIPVAVGAGAVPMLGMLMLPKTVCYILMLVVFLRYSAREKKA